MEARQDPQQEAIEFINRILREEHTGYSFEGLRHHFKAAYFDGSWTIKPPSGSELEFDRATVTMALFGPRHLYFKHHDYDGPSY